jgi:Tol biopolymer transport system component
MRVMTKWALLLGLSALSLWAVAQAPTVTPELYPWIADNGVVVWQELLPPRRTDLFQPSAAFPDPLSIVNVGVRAIVPANPDPVTIPNAARPQVSADGQWLVYYQADTTTTTAQTTAQVYVLDLTNPNATPKLISYKNWSDADGDGVRDGTPEPSGTAILPAISGSGRIVAFLSRDPDLNDPQGDGNGPSAQAPPLGRWLIYIHDRDADGNDTLDEAKVGGTTTRFVPDPTGNTPLFVTLTEVRLSLDQTGRSLAFSTWTGTQWQLWFVPDVQNPSPQQIATSSSRFSIPSVAGSRLAFTASGQFSWLYSVPTPPDPGVHVIDILSPSNSRLIQTNGVNGAPVLSRDGNLLAFHSTMTGFRVNGGPWQPLPDKRNAVDDVFVFNLTTGQPTWSTLVLRQGNPKQFPPYAPCVNPALPSSSVNLIAFQEIVNGASQVRVIDRSSNTVLR